MSLIFLVKACGQTVPLLVETGSVLEMDAEYHSSKPGQEDLKKLTKKDLLKLIDRGGLVLTSKTPSVNDMVVLILEGWDDIIMDKGSDPEVPVKDLKDHPLFKEDKTSLLITAGNEGIKYLKDGKKITASTKNSDIAEAIIEGRSKKGEQQVDLMPVHQGQQVEIMPVHQGQQTEPDKIANPLENAEADEIANPVENAEADEIAEADENAEAEQQVEEKKNKKNKKNKGNSQ